MNLKEQLSQLQKDLLTLSAKAKSEGREFTDAEVNTINEKGAEITKLKQKIERVEKSEKALADVVEFGRGEGDGEDDDSTAVKYLTLTGARGKKAAREFAENVRARGGSKALPGNTIVTGSSFSAEPIDTKKLPTSILDLLRVRLRENPAWDGIRQTGFTNNATVVPDGALKPTSTLSITNNPGFLAVVAHLSEYVGTYLLKDNAQLATFVERNLLWGLKDALEEQILNGTGLEDTYDGKPRKNIRGIMNTTGVQQQDATAEPIITLRAASTKLETAGFASDVYMLNPLDWEAIETNRNTSGNFDLGSALNLAERRVWGTRVVTSSRLEQGTALAMDLSALNLDTDRFGIETAWHLGDFGFEHNQIRARVEGRFGLSIEQPEGIVVTELDATP